ncbi:MAG: glycosyl transferase family protein [Elusimicrobia bacterium]|nr:MAG: glycosyl transferase family protein [Elusimicrobiota bacterium]KAF0157340.1 MAG: glycosyl transferase family protein [Elusimicrobiota bacterium]
MTTRPHGLNGKRAPLRPSAVRDLLRPAPAAAALLFLVLSAGGIRWALPNAYHVNTYNCDENTAIANLQAMDPAKLDLNPVGPKTPYALGEGTFNLYTYAALLKTLSAAGVIKLTTDKEFYYSNPGEWGKFFKAGRLLSAAYGALTVLMVFLLAKSMFGPAAGFIAALLIAVLPAHVTNSRYLIMTVPGTFWIVLSFYFLKKLMDSGAVRDYLLAGTAAGLAASTRYSGLPAVFMPVAAHLIAGAPVSRLWKAAAAIAAAAFFFLLGTPYALLDHENFIKGLLVVGGLAGGAGPAGGALDGLRSVYVNFSQAMGSLTLAACAGGVVLAAFRRTRDDLLLLAWVLPLLAIFLKAGENALASRILPVLPFLVILAGRALAELGAHHPRLARGLAALLLGQALLFHAAAFRLVRGTDIRDEASAWMVSAIAPGSSIGLIKEPSWFSPGLIERKYRHPGHRGLPDFSYIPLHSDNWAFYTGYDRLAELEPEYVVLSSVEEELPGGRGARAALAAAGYRVEKDFTSEFAVFGMKLYGKMPQMLFTPDRLTVFRK